MSKGFGPDVVASIDEAWLRGNNAALQDYARRAAVLCATSVSRGELDDAKAFAESFEQLIALSAEVTMRGISS